jgi:hypothetical protein
MRVMAVVGGHVLSESQDGALPLLRMLPLGDDRLPSQERLLLRPRQGFRNHLLDFWQPSKYWKLYQRKSKSNI